uniref:Succinate dehydrogenase assembly factor 3 n=1 Tax=Schistocephalus solidus TaxID=70667 RepID=A0A0V0J5T3_SCHSO
MSSHQVMTHPERVRFLYKMILRLHRSLPTEMRLVGDKYVREEFRKHKTAEKQFVGPFMIEWSRYAATLAEQLKLAGQRAKLEKSAEQIKIGIPLQDTDLEKFSAKQLSQLLELADEFYKSEKLRKS